MISIDLSAIKSTYAPGVSEPSSSCGLTRDQVINLVSLNAKQSKCLVVSEYNPPIEKLMTGALVHEIVLAFLFGIV